MSMYGELKESMQAQSLREVIVDHLIHNGSNEYAILLTDQGNVHIYNVFEGKAAVEADGSLLDFS